MRPLVDRLRDTSGRQSACGWPVSAKMLADAADEIERLRTAILTTLADAPCAHLADNHGHERCGTIRVEHRMREGFEHSYTRPALLDALVAVVGDNAR